MDGIKYRDSNEMIECEIEWINEIPFNWSKTKIKHLANGDYKSFVDGDWIESQYIQESGIRLIQTGNIGIGNYKEKGFRYISNHTFKELNCTEIKPNDVLICRLADPVGRACLVPFLKEKMITSVDVCILTPNMKYDSKYIVYTLSSNQYISFANNIARGGTRQRISRTQLGDIDFVSPPLMEQQKIANFLDIKTSQFDSIISKKEQFIQKLEEAKKSLISEVVTGKVKIVDGKLVELDPSEMKDSGVEWLGMIPKEWEVKRIKNLFDLRNERNSRKMDEVQILTLYTSIGVRRQEEVENKTGNTVRTVQDYKIVYPNDIIVNIILAWMGAIGVSKDNGVISPAYDIYKPHSGINSTYYNYLFRIPKFSGECFRYGRGIMLMRWRTYSDEFRRICVCTPPSNEQDLLSKYLNFKTNNINEVINQNKLQIEKLKQAKQSLISEAVTGKIDLRDWEIIEKGELQ